MFQVVMRAAAAAYELVGGIGDRVPGVGRRRRARNRFAVAAPLRLPEGALAAEPAGARPASRDGREPRGSTPAHPQCEGGRGQRAVLVINASTALGRDCIAHLMRSRTRTRWSVIAGVGSLAEAAQLTAAYGDDVRPVGLDLRDACSIERTLEEVASLVGEAGLAIVHIGDEAAGVPLESVFDDADADAGRAAQALAALFGHGERLVLVAPETEPHAADTTLAGALDVLAARETAGEREVAVTWIRSGCGEPSAVGVQIEQALSSARHARLSFGA